MFNLGQYEEQPFGDSFNEMGYGDIILVRNLGTVLLYMIVLVGSCLVLFILKVSTKKCPR